MKGRGGGNPKLIFANQSIERHMNDECFEYNLIEIFSDVPKVGSEDRPDVERSKRARNST